MKKDMFEVLESHPVIKEGSFITLHQRGQWTVNNIGIPFLYSSRIVREWENKGFIKHIKGLNTAAYILKKVCAIEKVPLFDMIQKIETHDITEKRQIAVYLIKEHTDLTFNEIHSLFLNYSRSWANVAHTNIKERIRVDLKLRNRVQKIENAI